MSKVLSKRPKIRFFYPDWTFWCKVSLAQNANPLYHLPIIASPRRTTTSTIVSCLERGITTKWKLLFDLSDDWFSFGELNIEQTNGGLTMSTAHRPDLCHCARCRRNGNCPAPLLSDRGHTGDGSWKRNLFSLWSVKIEFEFAIFLFLLSDS